MDAMQSTQEASTPQGTPFTDTDMQRFQLGRQFGSGANWFFWIAGLSLVNSVMMLTGQEWGFIVGLGATQMIDGIILGVVEEANAGAWLKYLAFGMDVMVAGVYVLFGFLARKGFKAGFIIGMIFYAIDGLIFLLVMDLLSIGFHLFALFCIFNGLKALNRLQQPPSAAAVMPAAGAVAAESFRDA